jgi:hypothetical protein
MISRERQNNRIGVPLEGKGRPGGNGWPRIASRWFKKNVSL